MASGAQRCEDLVSVYKCLCDLNRLRILNLLFTGPQCVCHLEGALEIGSVRTSQQLAYLRRHGLVEVEVCGTWRRYSLPATPPAELAANLACLQDCVADNAVFKADLRRLQSVRRARCGPESS